MIDAATLRRHGAGKAARGTVCAMDDAGEGVDLSGLHRELDRLKVRLCRCNHAGECLACRGFEVLRQQSQMVAAAASQPVLMQVAQEAALKDMLAQLGGVGDKLSEDTRLQELMGQVMERVQERLGGAEAMQRLFSSLGGFPGFSELTGFGVPGSGGKDDEPPEDRPRRDTPFDDLPPDDRPRRPRSED